MHIVVQCRRLGGNDAQDAVLSDVASQRLVFMWYTSVRNTAVTSSPQNSRGGSRRFLSQQLQLIC